MANNPRFSERIQEDPLEELPQLFFPPIASFNITKLGGNQIQAHSTSTDPDGSIVQHRWTWGDEQAIPTAFYTYQITGLSVAFTNLSTAISPATLASAVWDYGDGQTSTTMSASHTHVYATGGSYLVSLTVTDSGGKVSAPYQQTLNLSTGTGRPWGPTGPVFSGSAPVSFPEVTGAFTLFAPSGIIPANVGSSIDWCRDHDRFIMLILTGGAHSNYMTNGVFDMNKYKAVVNKFKIEPYKSQIQRGFDDGVMPGFWMIDEPMLQSGTKDWGPTMGRQLLDDMASYYHTIWPKIPCGIAMPHDADLAVDTPSKFSVVDFQFDSYLLRKGPVDDYIARGLQYGIEQGLVMLFQPNPLNGGNKPIAGSIYEGCPQPLTGGPGTVKDGVVVNCAMTAAQYETFTLACVRGGAAAPIWQYNQSYFSRPEIIAASNRIAAVAATLSRPKWSIRL